MSSNLVFPKAKRFYHNNIDGVHIFAGPVILQPQFEYKFAQKNDRIAPMLIIGKGFFYINLRKNLDFHTLEGDLISYFRKLKGTFDISIIKRLVSPIQGPTDGSKFDIVMALEQMEYQYKKGHPIVNGNVAEYPWSKTYILKRDKILQ